MKTFDERMKSVLEKAERGRQQRRNRRMALSLICLFLILTGAAVLFVPFDSDLPDVSMYSDSPYFSLIQRLNEATYVPPAYKNNFEKLAASLQFNKELSNGVSGEIDYAPNAGALADSPEGTSNYQEVTDNQVEGVIEADLVKRSDQFIYHLNRNTLNVYSINGEDSELVNSITLYTNTVEDKETAYYYAAEEMYLSQDCSTITVVMTCFEEYKSESRTYSRTYVCLKNYAVTNGSELTEAGCFYITGGYLSSRLVDGKILLMSQFRVKNDLDFDKEETYLPQMGTLEHMESLCPEGIIAPNTLTDTRYTVVTRLDGTTLEQEGAAAFLSYSSEVYVSKDHVFATRSYADLTPAEGDFHYRKAMTEIACIGYTGEVLESKGTFSVEGSVKDQYSMDEKDGVLRLVTSTSASKIREYGNEYITSAVIENEGENANLYCVSIGDWQILGKVEAFAPPGETVRSVRFDGDIAYVCTSVQLSDPVFFFDLSDLSNITWKETGTIEGYSTSLVNFGNGYLLGIGYGGEWGLKIEVYEESGDSVISVCKYELPSATFSQDYKAYLIDKTNQLIGLGVCDYAGNEDCYILLKFDGYSFTELVREELLMELDTVRGIYIDGFLYILGDEFRVVSVW